MENNSILISAYVVSNGKCYRNYYVVFNGVVSQIKLDSQLDFIKDNFKKCPCYDYNDLKKVIKNEIGLAHINTTTFNDIKLKYGVKQ